MPAPRQQSWMREQKTGRVGEGENGSFRPFVDFPHEPAAFTSMSPLLPL